MKFHNVIDTDHYYEAGIETLFFPGGEPYVKMGKWPERSVHIFAKVRTWNDAGILASVLDVLDQQGVMVSVFMPYMPGARADHKGSPLTGRLYAALFSTARRIVVLDPHSQASLNIWTQSGATNLALLSSTAVFRDSITIEPDFLVCPDKGARARTNAAALALWPDDPLKQGYKVGQEYHDKVVYCLKERDPATGHLSKFVIPNLSKIAEGARLLVTDDICDGGGTFLGWKAALNEVRPDIQTDLFVTHGIFSNGATHRLLNYYLGGNQGFDSIYTTDSFYDSSDHNVYVTQLLPYYFGGLQP